MNRYVVTWFIEGLTHETKVNNKFTAFSLAGTLSHHGQVKDLSVYDTKKEKNILIIKNGLMQKVR